MKSIHFINPRFLLFFTILFLSCSSWAQLNFKFKFTNEGAAVVHTTGTHSFASDEPGDISLTHWMFTFPDIIDLSTQCEGDIVIVDNYSNGSYGGYSLTPATLWDAKWGKRIFDGGGGFVGWDIFSNFPVEDEQWDFWDFEKTITIPNSADDDSEFTYHHLYVAPELGGFFGGVFDSTPGCTRVLELVIKVKSAPSCFEDLVICPGDIVDDALLGLGTGVTAGSWYPSDPRLVPPTETTNYTYILDNGTCTFDCGMLIEVDQPDVEFTWITELCYDEVFTFTEDDFWDLSTVSTTASSIEVDGEIYEEDDFPIIISGATHGEGIVAIQYNYVIGTRYCSKIYEIEIHPEIEIDLPTTIIECDSNFEELCGPLSTIGGPIYTYEWWRSDPELMLSVLVSTSRCFTPEIGGEYRFILTDQYGCSAIHHFSIVFYSPIIPELPDVIWCSDDMTMPVIAGWLSDPFADYPCTPEYEWTFDGILIEGASGYNLPFMGEGTYCVTVTFEYSSVTICFDMFECCPPNPNFSMNWMIEGDGSLRISLMNISSENYESDTYYLEKDCNHDGMAGPWEFVDEHTRVEFDTDVVFDGLDPDCFYRITHRVPSECLMKVFVRTGYVGTPGGPHQIGSLGNGSENIRQRSLTISPNPTTGATNLFIENIESTYQINVYNLQGQLIKSLETREMNTEINLEDLTAGIYLIKASDGVDSFTKRVVKM